MKNILKPGKTPKETVYQLKCDNCECVFEFDNSDIFIKAAGMKCGVQCPECGKTIYFERKDAIK